MSKAQDTSTRRSQLSPARQALLAQLKRGALAGAAEHVIPRRKTTGPAQLSFAQQRLWFLDQLAPNSAAYNVIAVFRISGAIDPAVLERTVNELVRRHESLRTTFVTEEGQPMQVIAPSLTIALPLIDLQHVAAAERSEHARQLAIDESRQPFDLQRGPLLRTTLLRLTPDEHYLVLTMHHIISDGWSMGVFFQEFGALCDAFAQDKPSALRVLPIQYADYAEWQREWLSGDVLAQQLSYWMEQVTTAPHVLELPLDFARPATQTFHGARHRLAFPKKLSQALRTLSQQEHTTLFMTLLAAFQVLLYRYTEQQTMLIGTPIANRTKAETEGVIGLFANTLVLRGDLQGNPTFRALLGRVREMALGAYAHQDLPFERLVEELHLERDMARNPLFQVMFSLQNAPMQPIALSGLAVAPVRIDRETAAFDLMLEMAEQDATLFGHLIYNTDLFAPETISRLGAQYVQLLESIVAAPDTHIGDLELLPSAERNRLLREWNATTQPIEPRCVHQLVAAQAERTPDATALVFGEQRLSYAALMERVDLLARHLRRLGVQGDVLVGVSMPRSIEMVVAVLAVLKAGGAYVPLDPSYPQDRLQFMLDDAQVAVLLTEAQLIDQLPTHQAQVVCVTRDWAAIAAQPATDDDEVALSPDNLAYIIYTSGSTGRPKGVQITHGSLVNFLQAMQSQPGLTSEDVLLSVTTLSFDIAGLELWLPLITGARIVLAEQPVAADSRALAALIDSAGATVMQATPATWRLLLTGGWQGRSGLKILCGGEAMPPDLAAALTTTNGSLWNMYGPTETTVWSTLSRVDPSAQPITIGRPIANTQLYLLDARMQPVPTGVPGALYIGGAGLARGYLKRPALTAERFVPHPFSPIPGARLYQTGDVARYQPDGSLLFLGRNDYQVKLRGFRIELGEIEAQLQQHPAIAACAVLVREVGAEQQLVAYVVGEQRTENGEQKNQETKNQEPKEQGSEGTKEQRDDSALSPEGTPSALRAFLQERLPSYMIPAAFVVLAALPLTPNGKIDRKALLVDTTPMQEQTRSYTAPRTPEEEIMAEIWGETLGLERVGIHDNFFVIGGHSLLATRLIARLRTVFQVELTLGAVFEAPTVAEMVEVVEDLLIEKLAALPEDEIARLTASASLDDGA